MKGALLVGIDHYAPPNELKGCVNDARSLRIMLARDADDSSNFECVELSSSDSAPLITAQDIRGNIATLLNSEADTAFIHFSGHGIVEDPGGSALVAQNGESLRLDDLVKLMSQSPVRQKVMTLDCCFAGGVGADEFLGAGLSVVPEGATILAAARSGELAAESEESGAFTSYLIAGLDGGAADVLGNVTAAGLYAYLDEAFGVLEQRPVMKASLTRLVRLRSCEPLVPLDTLRRLPELFPDPEGDFQLDPSYEDTEEDHDPDHAAIFKELQKCAAARLVVPVDERHMYFAAMNSKACRLTALGKRYRRLAESDRL